MIPQRYWTWAASVLLACLCLLLTVFSGLWLWPAAAFATVALVGVWDFLQSQHSIRRNYPVLAHLRFFFEKIRPEIRQYLIESDTDAVPFSRAQRSIVYQRAKSALDKRPFGTQMDVYAPRYEWINHSIAPTTIDNHDFRVTIGADCAQPYSASAFNISAMSFGALSANAILALNAGARRGGFYHDTGEGSISRYHLQHRGDLVWEIGSGYFGCRNAQGQFDEEKFAASAGAEQVRMIEIKLSQGAKPGHGGVLPGAKVTAEIAAARGVLVGVDCISPARHSAFTTPIELLQFVERLRALSGGKPTGFKLTLGHPWEWFSIAKAMLDTGLTPDFIVVDGGEGGTGAAPLEFTNHVGAPLREGLRLIHNTLVGLNLRERIRIGAAGKIITAFDVARTMAIGADWCNSARGFMFSLGCLQAQTCHTGNCPTGVTSQDPQRSRGLVVTDKSERVFNFHEGTLEALRELLQAAGLNHPEELGPEHIMRRVSAREVRSLATLHPWLSHGELLDSVPQQAVYQTFWRPARPDRFIAPDELLSVHVTKRER